MSERLRQLPCAVIQQEGAYSVRPWCLSGVEAAQVPSHNVLSDHYVIQRQVTQWSEVGRLPFRLLSSHLAAEVGGHEVSLGLVRDHQLSGCRLEGWDFVLGDRTLLLLHQRSPSFGVSLSAGELPPFPRPLCNLDNFFASGTVQGLISSGGAALVAGPGIVFSFRRLATTETKPRLVTRLGSVCSVRNMLDREDGIGECCHILVHIPGEFGRPVSDSQCLFYYLPVCSVPKPDDSLGPFLISGV